MIKMLTRMIICDHRIAEIQIRLDLVLFLNPAFFRLLRLYLHQSHCGLASTANRQLFQLNRARWHDESPMNGGRLELCRPQLPFAKCILCIQPVQNLHCGC